MIYRRPAPSCPTITVSYVKRASYARPGSCGHEEHFSHCEWKPVGGSIEPRTSLADFLRNDQFLTGTHLGCEHGVCGACTLLIDGTPMRSCITLAAATDGTTIRTVEGYHGDRVMDVIRDCFSASHALQCGFWTPGMLATAYDVVARLPDANRERIKLEFSGNLCRCTGYLGIINAVEMAIKKLKA